MSVSVSHSVPVSTAKERRMAQWFNEISNPDESASHPWKAALLQKGYTFEGHLVYAPDKKPIGNFVCWFTDKKRRFGETVSRKWNVTGEIIETGEILPNVEITAAEFEHMDWITKKWVATPNMLKGAKESVKQMLRSSNHLAAEQIVCSKFGWHVSGTHRFYVHAGGAIGSGGNQVAIDQSLLDEKMNLLNLPSPISAVTHPTHILLDFLKMGRPHVTYPLAASILAAPLASMMNASGVRLDFVPFLIGKSESGKSTVAALCQSAFGRFDKSTFLASFLDTTASLEPKIELMRDMLLVVDDFHPTNPGKQDEMSHMADALSRMVADGNVRNRTGQRSRRIEGLCMCTGELRPNMAGSGTKRFLFIDICKKDLAYSDKVLPVIERSDELRAFMSAYISWIGRNWNQLAAEMKVRVDNWKSEFPDFDGRIKESAAKLAAAFDVGLEYLLISSVINEASREHYRQLMQDGLQKVLRSQAGLPDGEKYLNAVKTLLQQGLSVLASSKFSYSRSCRMIGFREDNKVYLRPEDSVRAVNSFLGKRNSFQEPITVRRVLAALNKEGFISYDQVKKRFSVQKSLGKKTGGVYFIELDSSLLEVDE